MLRLLVVGLTNDEIGAKLRVSEATVKAHVSSLLRKSGAPNRAGLAAVAVGLGIVPAPE